MTLRGLNALPTEAPGHASLEVAARHLATLRAKVNAGQRLTDDEVAWLLAEAVLLRVECESQRRECAHWYDRAARLF